MKYLKQFYFFDHEKSCFITYISWKKLCSNTFKASSEEVIVMRSEKMKAKYEGGYVKKFFS